jgi:predicted nucleic acid-binding protein
MTDGKGPAVVDTMVFSWCLVAQPSETGRRYAHHLLGRTLVLAAQTVTELRYGARARSWGQQRQTALEARIARLKVAGVDDRLTTTYAELEDHCMRTGHALGQKLHDGDRWIATTAIRYGIPLISDDSIFCNAPGLQLITELKNTTG